MHKVCILFGFTKKKKKVIAKFLPVVVFSMVVV